MILGIILFVLFIKGINKMYRKSVSHNVELLGNYLYETIRAANSG